MGTKRKHWSTRRKGTVLLALLSLLTVAAIAATFYRAPIAGGGTIKVPPGVKFIAASFTSGSPDVTCSAVLNGGGTVTVNMEAFPGDHCNFQLELQRTGSAAVLVLQDIRFASNVTEGYVNAGDCGLAVPPAPSTIIVNVKFTVAADATPGAITAQVDAGVLAVKQNEYSAAACPIAA